MTDDLLAIERAQVWVSPLEGCTDIVCGGDCLIIIHDECLPPSDIVYYNSLEEMNKAGWGTLQNRWTNYELVMMCPRCFQKYRQREE